MELWVRSQDKETLIKSYELYIRPYTNIYAIRAKKTSNIMGLYKSKQRALEILDEIHQRLIDLQTLNYTNDYRFSKGRNLDCVFIMPEE